MRSGTSFLTGLLERCGFDLGKNIRILRKSTEHNPGGHFEPDLLFAINHQLLTEVPGGQWHLLNVPGHREMAELACRRTNYFRTFIRKFDGNLFKDPLMCLTLSFWEAHWPDLTRAVFCLRHPLAVAKSMEKRYNTTLEEGLHLWKIYTERFFKYTRKCDIFVFDFDAFSDRSFHNILALFEWLDAPVSKEKLETRMALLVNYQHIHWVSNDLQTDAVPVDIKQLYQETKRYNTG